MFLEAYQLVIFTEVAGEMAQHLRALAALAEDPGSVPSTYMVAHVGICNSNSRGFEALF